MCKDIILFIHTNKSQLFRGMRDIEEDVIKCEKKGSLRRSIRMGWQRIPK